MKEKNYFFLRIGEGSKYIDEAYNNGFVAIGWNEVSDLKNLETLEKIKQELSQHYQYTSGQISMQAGQIFRFGNEMKPDDIVISHLGSGEYLVGILGDYYFEKNTKGMCPYKHRRKVKWLENRILKEDMSTNLSYAVGAIMTIFSLNKYTDEIEVLIAGEKYTPAEKPERIRDIILSGLMDLDGKEFEKFISHLLEIIGFTSETTQYTGDKGIDVNGILNAEGLANIVLRLQVKRKNSSINNKEVLALRGALCQEEHGCFIATSTFTKQAIEEAESPGKKTIKLIDGNDLSGIILKNFEGIDDQYKNIFGIRKPGTGF